MVSPSLFDVLQVRPILGRPFAAAEEQEPVTVISHRFWQMAFGGDSSVLDRMVGLDGRSYQVIGVLPPTVRYPSADVELWIPIGWSFVSEPGLKTNRSFYAFNGIARLQPGVTVDRLSSDLVVVASRIDAELQVSGGGNRR